jgi:hypothetical protein
MRPDGGAWVVANLEMKGEAKARGRASAAAATVFGLVSLVQGSASANTGSHGRARHDESSVGRACTRNANT